MLEGHSSWGLPAGLAVVRRVVGLLPVAANVPLADHAPLGTDQGVLHLQRSSHGAPGTQPWLTCGAREPTGVVQSQQEVSDTLKVSQKGSRTRFQANPQNTSSLTQYPTSLQKGVVQSTTNLRTAVG